MKQIDAWLEIIAIALNKVGAWVALPLMTAVTVVDVTLRYVFNAPLNWGVDAAKHLLLLVFVFGMLEAFRSGAHIRMELFFNQLPGAARKLVNLIYSLCALGVFFLLTRKAAEETAHWFSLGEVSPDAHLPKWIFYALITGMAALIFAFFVARTYLMLRGEREDLEEQHSPFLEDE